MLYLGNFQLLYFPFSVIRWYTCFEGGKKQQNLWLGGSHISKSYNLVQTKDTIADKANKSPRPVPNWEIQSHISLGELSWKHRGHFSDLLNWRQSKKAVKYMMVDFFHRYDLIKWLYSTFIFPPPISKPNQKKYWNEKRSLNVRRRPPVKAEMMFRSCRTSNLIMERVIRIEWQIWLNSCQMHTCRHFVVCTIYNPSVTKKPQWAGRAALL